MKVILKEDIRGTGRKGEVLNVATGYARNYLFPKDLACAATPGNLQDLARQKEDEAQKQADSLTRAQELGRQLAEVSLLMAVKTGEGGRLFGSINNRDIGEILAKEKGFKIDKRKILVEGAIKELGVYPIAIRLHPEVTVTIKVQVVEAE